ncbi:MULTISPECIES: hypothetical protein [unclassified Empedobacter]|uniref:hypothetical protein n=1 Tax=unclassified Empedobacter TaxID=2643773 RepID=UPI0025C4FBE1|nr:MULTISPECIES: hypothetical protein [unclassified Empedobacter]
MRFFTENDKEVTDRAKDGRTKIFFDVKPAEKYARQKRSYLYPLFAMDNKKKIIAYGVPK